MTITPQKKSSPLQWAPRPAPYLPGLHSAQATHNDDHTPFVSVYRQSSEAAEKWIRTNPLVATHTSFFLRSQEHSVRLYEQHGKIVKNLTAPSFEALYDLEESIRTDRDAMLHEAREILNNQRLILIVCAEGHAGASAADHSNFVIACRRMIIEASTTDLEHIFVVESRRWPCRVTGIYADITALSPAMQDIYLERYKWLSNSWPLNTQHFLSMLADRLVRSRSSYVTDLLHDCGLAARMSPEMILTLQSVWMLASTGAKYRFAQHLVKTLQEGILFEVHDAEVFTPEIVESHGADVIRNYRTFLG
jgi:hypothetical protein